jgi:hypothetical protein
MDSSQFSYDVADRINVFKLWTRGRFIKKGDFLTGLFPTKTFLPCDYYHTSAVGSGDNTATTVLAE